MSDDVQDVLQRTKWPFTERRRRRFIAMQTKEAAQLQIRNLILPWLEVVSRGKEEAVLTFGYTVKGGGPALTLGKSKQAGLTLTIASPERHSAGNLSISQYPITRCTEEPDQRHTSYKRKGGNCFLQASRVVVAFTCFKFN